MSKFLLLLTCFLLTACSININFGPDNTPNSTIAPQATILPTSTPVITPAPIPINEQISLHFQQKFNTTADQLQITVNQNTSTHASGLVKEISAIGGGWWLAHLEGTTWIVDADGNGTVPCEAVLPHDYPISLVPECWDDATSKLIKF